MPQFDTLSFFSQITWVFLLFALIYLLVSFFVSPTVSTILKVRNVWSDQSGNSTSSNDLSSIAVETDNVSLSTSTNFMGNEMVVNFLTSTSVSFLSEIFNKVSSLKPFISNFSFTSFFRSHLF